MNPSAARGRRRWGPPSQQKYLKSRIPGLDTGDLSCGKLSRSNFMVTGAGRSAILKTSLTIAAARVRAPPWFGKARLNQ